MSQLSCSCRSRWILGLHSRQNFAAPLFHAPLSWHLELLCAFAARRRFDIFAYGQGVVRSGTLLRANHAAETVTHCNRRRSIILDDSVLHYRILRLDEKVE